MFRHASDREAVYACFTFSHWLVYANSAANPIIYNFLSGKWPVDVMTEDGHGPWVRRRLGGEGEPALMLALSSDPEMYPGQRVTFLHTSAYEESQGLGMLSEEISN